MARSRARRHVRGRRRPGHASGLEGPLSSPAYRSHAMTSRAPAAVPTSTPSRRPRLPADDRQRVRGLVLVGGMAALMWLVEVVDLVAGDLDSAGIRPRDPEGLPGIVLAP